MDEEEEALMEVEEGASQQGQEAMALEAEIDRTYASQIERGVGNPSLKVICALAEVLKVHPNTLFTPKA